MNIKPSFSFLVDGWLIWDVSAPRYCLHVQDIWWRHQRLCVVIGDESNDGPKTRLAALSSSLSVIYNLSSNSPRLPRPSFQALDNRVGASQYMIKLIIGARSDG